MRWQLDPTRMKALGINYEPKSWLEKDILPHIEDFIEKEKLVKNSGLLRALTDYHTHITNQHSFKDVLKKKLRISVILISVIFLNSIITIPFLNYLVYKQSLALRIDVLTSLAFSIVLIVDLIRYIFFALKPPEDAFSNNPIVNRFRLHRL